MEEIRNLQLNNERIQRELRQLDREAFTTPEPARDAAIIHLNQFYEVLHNYNIIEVTLNSQRLKSPEDDNTVTSEATKQGP